MALTETAGTAQRPALKLRGRDRGAREEQPGTADYFFFSTSFPGNGYRFPPRIQIQTRPWTGPPNDDEGTSTLSELTASPRSERTPPPSGLVGDQSGQGSALVRWFLLMLLKQTPDAQLTRGGERGDRKKERKTEKINKGKEIQLLKKCSL